MNRDPELVLRLIERDLIEWADDDTLRLVWADYLQLQGDPLGELVVLDDLAEYGPVDQRERLRAQAERMRTRLHGRLWTNRSHEQKGVHLRWHQGFVRELEVVIAEMPGRAVRSKAQHLDGILQLILREPALRFVEIIRITVPEPHGETWLQWLLRGRVYLQTLREVHVGRPAGIASRPAGTWESQQTPKARWSADVAQIQHFQRLRWLTVDGELLRLPCRDGSTETKSHFVRSLASRPLTSPNRAALCRALWDASTKVHDEAFAVIATLGPRAEFCLEDLLWMLEPPLGKRDPRPAKALRAMAAIGPAGARGLRVVLGALNHSELLQSRERAPALLEWLGSLGPAGTPALAVIDALLERSETGGELRQAARRARKRISS